MTRESVPTPEHENIPYVPETLFCGIRIHSVSLTVTLALGLSSYDYGKERL